MLGAFDGVQDLPLVVFMTRLVVIKRLNKGIAETDRSDCENQRDAILLRAWWLAISGAFL